MGITELEKMIEDNGMKLIEGVTIEDDIGIPYFLKDGEHYPGTRRYKSMYFYLKEKGWITKK